MLYTVWTNGGRFVMTAPMDIIARAFDLQPPAVDRVEAELRRQPSSKSEVFFNNRARLGFTLILIAYSTVQLDLTA